MAAAAAGANSATFESWIAAKHVDASDLAKYKDGSLLDYLASETLVQLTNTWSEVSAIDADAPLAAWLGVQEGAPLLRLAETFYTRSGEPIMFSLNHFLTEKVAFHIIRKVELA